MKDLFGAVFFISVGMMVDPKIIIENAGTIALLATVVILGMITFGTVGIGWMEDEEGQVRYADQDGHLAIGLTQIDGNRYFFLDPNQGCVMARNQFITAAASGTRFEYYAGADGRLAVGWQEVFGVLHYFDADGHMLYDTVQDGRYINIYGEVI